MSKIAINNMQVIEELHHEIITMKKRTMQLIELLKREAKFSIRWGKMALTGMIDDTEMISYNFNRRKKFLEELKKL